MVNFRMDAKLKKNMESVCKDMGLSITTAFTIFATKVTREHRIPFEINSDPFYSKANMEYLSRAASEIDNGTAKLSQRRLLALSCILVFLYRLKRQFQPHPHAIG